MAIESRQRSQLDQRRELGIHQEQVDQLHFQKMMGQMPVYQSFILFLYSYHTSEEVALLLSHPRRNVRQGGRLGLTPEETEAEADPEADIDIEADRLADSDWEDEADAEAEEDEEAVLIISWIL
jgi:hypothetical protein